VITGLAGIRPQEGNKLTVNPLVPDTWDYFCLENLVYKGHKLTVLYDRDGKKYKKGKGLMLFVDGKLKKKRKDLGSINVNLF
jgi:trehalose/maltose hydrolase-like predicted phosphorylase